MAKTGYYSPGTRRGCTRDVKGSQPTNKRVESISRKGMSVWSTMKTGHPLQGPEHGPLLTQPWGGGGLTSVHTGNPCGLHVTVQMRAAGSQGVLSSEKVSDSVKDGLLGQLPGLRDEGMGEALQAT